MGANLQIIFLGGPNFIAENATRKGASLREIHGNVSDQCLAFQFKVDTC